jgi:hypothetical protein
MYRVANHLRPWRIVPAPATLREFSQGNLKFNRQFLSVSLQFVCL